MTAPSKEIAVRHTVQFGQYRDVEIPLAAPLPKNTLDPRYAACVDHRTACDCREAWLAEDLAEFRSELEHIKRVFDEVLAGHATRVVTPGNRWDEQLKCTCTGCEIARRTHLRFASTVVALADSPRRDLLDDEGEVPF